LLEGGRLSEAELVFFDWTEILLGRVGGRLLQFFYMLWFIHITTVIINEFGYFMNIAFLPVALVFTALLLVLTGVAVYGGVETIGRLSIMVLPVTLAIILGLTIMAAGLYDFSNLLPFLERGMAPVVAGAVPPGTWHDEVFLGAMLFPFLARPSIGGWVLCRAVLYITVLLVLDALAVDLASETARLSLPVYSLAREINLLHFFQHLEVFVLAAWVAGAFCKLAVWYYVIVLGMAQWLNLRSYRVLPADLLLAALSLVRKRKLKPDLVQGSP